VDVGGGVVWLGGAAKGTTASCTVNGSLVRVELRGVSSIHGVCATFILLRQSSRPSGGGGAQCRQEKHGSTSGARHQTGVADTGRSTDAECAEGVMTVPQPNSHSTREATAVSSLRAFSFSDAL
jgi:hypothetical protein